MARQTKRGATRKPVRKEKKVIAWHYFARQGVVVLAFLLLVATVLILRQGKVLPILHVTVEGEFKHVEKAHLVEVVKPFTRGSFLSIDVDKISEAGESLAWIKQVQVRRVWPDSLHLTVEEQTPVARWNKQAYVNDEGELFPASKYASSAKMAVLKGPENSQEVMVSRYLKMNKQLRSQGLAITKLEMNKRRAWNMTLSNNMKVVLGRANSKTRFERFLRIYPSRLKQYQPHIAELDMRYPNGLSVIWKQGQQPDFNGTV